MSISIPLDAAQLAGTRFGISPAIEVVGSLRTRGRHPRPHARRWYARAASAMDSGQLELLHALVPNDHPYTPDFLLPYPKGVRDPIGAFSERIATTDPDLIDYHLDIALSDRPIRDTVQEQFGSRSAYQAWRRPTPPALAELIDRGPRTLAEAAADAMQAYFETALAPDWQMAESVLLDDIAYRADLMVAKGAGFLLEDLSDTLRWTGTGVELARPYGGIVDWPHDGPLLVPSTTQTDLVFSAEEPLPPLLIYAARGTARLDSGDDTAPAANALAEVIGATRTDLLSRLDRPRSTHTLSLDSGLSMATVSYHLGILRRADLVTKTRRGRQVLYQRTARATALFAQPD